MKIKNNIVKEPKVSLIITYYNLSKYINPCVSSVLNQNYQNFEIIIVNDNSDNENSFILKQFEKNKKIKIINLKENQGQLCAFMEGLKAAKGEFICMIDADDILLPNYINTLLYTHLNNNFALVSCACGIINENDEVLSLNYSNNPIYASQKTVNYKEIETLLKVDDKFTLKKVKAPFALWSWNPSSSAMFRREALKILDFYPDKAFWKTGADKVIFSLLHLVGGSVNISCVCYLYRYHNLNNSQSTKPVGTKKYLNDIYIEKLINWNKKIRLDTLKMFMNNKSNLIRLFNKFNYVKMFFKIVFCIDLKVCLKFFKALIFKLF